MSKIKVEMIMDNIVTFDADVEPQIVQYMMESEFVTINSNTIRVDFKEVSNLGIVRFYGSKANPNR